MDEKQTGRPPARLRGTVRAGDTTAAPERAARTLPQEPGAAGRRQRRAVPLGELVAPCLGPALAKQGFAAADVVLMWPTIVGDRLAAVCEPVKLQWPPRSRDRGLDSGAPAATLVIRVEGAFALELQHMAAVVVERVNAHLGWRCVAKLALRQAPVRRAPTPTRAPAAPPEAVERAERVVSAVTETPLREALARLGAAVFAGRSGRS